MNPITSLHPTSQAWLQNSALAPHVDAFATHLENGRYADNTIKNYFAGIAHFARWMIQSCLPLQMLDEHEVDQFLSNHLARCDCPSPVLRNMPDLRAALHHLLDVLRKQGWIAERQSPTGHIAAELHCYDEHMLKASGLSSGTRRGRLRTVGRLLLYKFANRPVVISELCPDDVRHFISSQLTTQLALEWAQQPSHTQPSHWAQRLSHVRCFARHHVASDPNTEVPPPGLLPFRPVRAHPYLYSNVEVQSLLEHALQLSPTTELRRWTYHALLGLLSVTGMRVGEALRLRLDDVDFDNGVLTVRGTKFGKSRLVPIHTTTRDVLASYRTRRASYLGDCDAAHFFVTRTGHQLDGGDVRRTFYDLSRQIGLRGMHDSHGPRLHDFRHRFAVETLLGWYRSGQDVERRLTVLSTYLGHVHVSDTYWYLSAHPELMTLAMSLMEQRWEVQP